MLTPYVSKAYESLPYRRSQAAHYLGMLVEKFPHVCQARNSQPNRGSWLPTTRPPTKHHPRNTQYRGGSMEETVDLVVITSNIHAPS